MALNTIILIVYLLATFVVAGWGYKVTTSSDDYWVAGRTLGVAVSTGTFFATLVSSWSVLGATGYFYQMGWAGYWQFGGTILTSVFASIWFGAKIRSTGYVTLSDILAARYYSKGIRLLTSGLVVFASIIFLTVQAMGAGIILNQITGINPQIGIILGVIIFLFFTVTGGMNSVAWTDFLQAIIIIVGVAAAVIIGLVKVGGFGAMHTSLAEIAPGWLDPFAEGKMGIVMIINWYIIWGVGNLGTPQFMSRFLACKDENVVRMSQGFTALSFAGFYFLIGMMGGLARIYFPGIQSSDMVGPTFVTGMLPPVIGAIIMSALMAAAMSTASSVLLAGATSFTRDIYQKVLEKDVTDKELVKVSRIITVIISIAALVFALMKISSIFWLQPNMVATMGAALATSLIAGFAWKRATREGAYASVLAGIIVSMVWFIFKLQATTGLHPVIPGTLSAIIGMVAVSLITKKPPQEVIDEFFKKEKSVA
jgi:sodium/proline symporter